MYNSNPKPSSQLSTLHPPPSFNPNPKILIPKTEAKTQTVPGVAMLVAADGFLDFRQVKV